MDSQPTKEDIEAVFQRLRALPANKVCFDCNAKNPTWSSVTYGIFICIDCSAVHRSLGVHLTFVRSTQLDTNWTWLQLRQMQLGGNSNAFQFFSQHNGVTSDSQKKYNSRAAQLYREKLLQAALNSSTCKNKLYIHTHQEQTAEEEEEVEVCSENLNISSTKLPILQSEMKDAADGQNASKKFNNGESLKSDYFLDSAYETQKSAMTSRKTPVKKTVLGTKKAGLGAVKVKTNFAELEKEAELAEELHINANIALDKNKATTSTQQEECEAGIRLVYKEVHTEQQNKKNQLKTKDPMKASQLERLGMGINSKMGISHSAVSDMEMIEQENMPTTTSTLSSLGKLHVSDDNFFDDCSHGKISFSMNRSTTKDCTKDVPPPLTENYSSRDTWVIVNDAHEKPKNKSLFGKPEKSSVQGMDVSINNKAQKVFGNAKSISSDQFFNDERNDVEVKANLSRFQGLSNISSADLFGTETTQLNNTSYDIEDVKESVRQGVTKVASKLGSITNGLMSSIQDRYGY